MTNDISNDLKLHYGYFAVKNKNKPELTYKQNNVLECEYFNNHPIYSQLDISKMGITNLRIYLRFCGLLSNLFLILKIFIKE